jgi:hypothetical protein
MQQKPLMVASFHLAIVTASFRVPWALGILRDVGSSKQAWMCLSNSSPPGPSGHGPSSDTSSNIPPSLPPCNVVVVDKGRKCNGRGAIFFILYLLMMRFVKDLSLLKLENLEAFTIAN